MDRSYRKNWLITSMIGPFTETELKSLDSQYIVVGEEVCPSTSKVHYHMYVQLKDRTRKSALIKLLGDRDIRGCDDKVDVVITYVKKDNKIVYEVGIPVKQGKCKAIQTIIDEVKDGNLTLPDIAISNPHLFNQYRRTIEFVQQATEAKRNWMCEVIILYGPTGTGKTRWCVEQDAVSVSYDSKFYSGYNGEDVVYFDEFDWTTMSRTEFLRITDRYAMNINIKGGSRNWKPRRIFFTTNDMSPELWYGGCPAFLRRITEFRRMAP